MADSTLRDRIMEEVSGLPPPLQQRVLDFVKTLARTTANGVPGKDLVRFAGVLLPEEIAAIARVVEEDYERMDESAW